MRIAISGTANQGKTTLIKDFLSKWTNYHTTEGSYRDRLPEGKHSSSTTEDTQWDILNWFVDEQIKAKEGDNIIFDRCTLDNFVYSLWAIKNGKIPGNYVTRSIDLVKESFRNLDIIFFIPYDERIPIVDDFQRDVDFKYICEIDNIFQGIYNMYVQADENLYSIFPKDDMPAIIPISGSRAERISQISDYIDYSGALIETDEKDSVLSEEKLAAVQALMLAQSNLLKTEESEAFAKKLKI
jgi:hypothetical protein